MLLFRNQGDGSNCKGSADQARDVNLIPGIYMGEGENRPLPPKKLYKTYPFPQNKYIKCNLKFNAFVLNQHQAAILLPHQPHNSQHLLLLPLLLLCPAEIPRPRILKA